MRLGFHIEMQNFTLTFKVSSRETLMYITAQHNFNKKRNKKIRKGFYLSFKSLDDSLSSECGVSTS